MADVVGTVAVGAGHGTHAVKLSNLANYIYDRITHFANLFSKWLKTAFSRQSPCRHFVQPESVSASLVPQCYIVKYLPELSPASVHSFETCGYASKHAFILQLEMVTKGNEQIEANN